MRLKQILLGLGLLMTLCTAAVAPLFTSSSVLPTNFAAAVHLTLVRRGVHPTALTVAVCPAGPTACYQRVYGTIQIDGARNAEGFFNCARGNADCRLTIPALEIHGTRMPDIAATGSCEERLRTVLTYYGAQVRALLRAHLSWSGW
jgi:hypothetical protein